MKVKHKVSGKVHEVSDDYFSKYEDKLQVLEEVEKPKPKPKKKTKIVTDDAPALPQSDPDF
jgi:hypothetical protein